MACHKILIDYSEYIRLKNYEAKFEEKNHANKNLSGESLQGAGAEWIKTPLKTPLMGTSDSITTPANAIEDVSELTDRNQDTKQEDNKVTSKKSIDGQALKAPKQKHWYYLGIPK